MTRKDKGVISRFLRQFILLVSLAVIPTAVIAGTGYYPSANVSGILPINLATSVTGVLPFANGGTGLSTLGTANQELRVNAGATALEYYTPSAGMTNPMTTTGDMITSSSGSTPARIAAVAAGSYMRSAGTSTQPVWSTLTLPNSASPGQILRASGSNAIAASTATYPDTVTSGNILYASGTNVVGNASAATLGLLSTADTPVSGDGLVYSGSAYRTAPYNPTIYSTTWRSAIVSNANSFSQITGTGSWAGVTDSSGIYDSVTTTGASGDADGNAFSQSVLTGATAWVRYDQKPRFYAHVKTGGSIANIRLWVGYSSNAFSGTVSSSDPALNMAAFRFATDTDGTNFWRTYSNDGTSTGTATTTTQAIAINTDYWLCVDLTDSANVRFYINGVLVATHSTNRPTATVSMTPFASVTTLTTATKTFLLPGPNQWRVDGQF